MSQNRSSIVEVVNDNFSLYFHAHTVQQNTNIANQEESVAELEDTVSLTKQCTTRSKSSPLLKTCEWVYSRLIADRSSAMKQQISSLRNQPNGGPFTAINSK